MPPSQFFKDHAASTSTSGVKLLTAVGSLLSCSGSRIIPLYFCTCRFEWLFQLAPVSIPILGVDFLRHHNLFLDLANQKVFSSFHAPYLLNSTVFFSPNFSTSCPLMVLQLLCLATKSATIFSHILVLLSLPNPTAWTQ